MKWLIPFIILISCSSFAQTADEVRRIMNSKNNLYQVLDVSPTASSEEIRAAYRKLMKIYHPDRFANDPQKLKAATEIGTKLNTTRDTLMDTVARQNYDAALKVTSKVSASARAATSSSAAKKWTPEDFSKTKAQDQAQTEKPKAPEKPTSEAPKTEKPKAQSTSAAEETPSAKAQEGSAQKTQSSTEARAQSAQTEVKPASSEPLGYRAQQAKKMYEDTAKCGQGFFKSFVDIML